MSKAFRWFVLSLSSLLAGPALAGGLPVTVSPDLIHLAGDEGDAVGQALTITNTGRNAATVKLQAVNWILDVSGQRLFNPVGEQPDDCRDWWQAGFADLLVEAGARTIHSVDVQIPDDLEEERECRFAIAVHSSSGEQERTDYIPLYVNAEGAEPELEFESLAILTDGKVKQPVIMLRNVGTAHARVVGMLEGEDAQGQELELVVRSTEVLPRETRAVPLLVSRRGGGELFWSAPLKVEGRIMWGDDDMDISGVLR